MSLCQIGGVSVAISDSGVLRSREPLSNLNLSRKGQAKTNELLFSMLTLDLKSITLLPKQPKNYKNNYFVSLIDKLVLLSLQKSPQWTDALEYFVIEMVSKNKLFRRCKRPPS